MTVKAGADAPAIIPFCRKNPFYTAYSPYCGVILALREGGNGQSQPLMAPSGSPALPGRRAPLR
jgi:hypothetical protein